MSTAESAPLSGSSHQPETTMTSSAVAHIPLTLVVATTPSLGIGLKGTLPWPALKAEMAYFARVTKRVPQQTSNLANPTVRHINAVVMGRSTYESIPRKFRPLKDRLNVVLTRAGAESDVCKKIESERKPGAFEGPLVVGSIGEALEVLGSQFGSDGKREQKAAAGRVFVIGGAEVYAQALRMKECERVLRTRIQDEFECDVFFPVKLGVEDGNGGEEWTKAGKKELDSWTGEDVPEGQQTQDDVRWEFEMWERRSAGQTR